MNYCDSCLDHDGSKVPAVAETADGLWACRECIRRDHHSVKIECEECGRERAISSEYFLDGDLRCDPCANKYAREVADANAGWPS